MYVAYFLCDTCGHTWETNFSKIKAVERGDACKNCTDRPPHRKKIVDCIVEPHFYEKVE